MPSASWRTQAHLEGGAASVPGTGLLRRLPPTRYLPARSPWPPSTLQHPAPRLTPLSRRLCCRHMGQVDGDRPLHRTHPQRQADHDGPLSPTAVAPTPGSQDGGCAPAGFTPLHHSAPRARPGSRFPSGRRTGSGRDTAVHVQRRPASARAQHRGRRARPRPGLHLKPVRRSPRRAPRSTWPDGRAQGGTGVGPVQPRPPLPGLWAPLPACPAPSRGCVRPRDLRGASPEDENLAGRGGAAGAQRRPPQPARPRNGASPGLD